MAGLVRKKNPGDAWETVSDVGGGGSPALTLLEMGFQCDLSVEGVTLASFAALMPPSPSAADINGCVTTVPAPAAAGPAFSGLRVDLAAIPDDPDGFGITAHFAAVNMAGTEILILRCQLTSPPHTPTASLDWTTATVNPVAGTDLSWDGANVVTAAGGVFAGMLMVHCEWD